MTIRQSQCEICNRYDKGYCMAFDGSPPAEIFNNEFLHDEPYEGDNGTRFMQNIDRRVLFTAMCDGVDKEYIESLKEHPFRKRMENTVNDDTVGEIGYSGVIGYNYEHTDNEVDKSEGVASGEGTHNARYSDDDDDWVEICPIDE